jgi:hypothetical protein
VAERATDLRSAAAVLGVVSTLLDTVDWDQVANDIGHAEALGPIVLPTEFAASLADGVLRRNRQAIDATREYLTALRRLVPPTDQGRSS